MKNQNNNNPFRSKSAFNQTALPGKIEKKTENWGKVKFNPVAKLASQESATPWSTFKTEIIQQQKNDARQSQHDANVKQINKIREENYRRNLIESKKNEPTKWEDFSEETESAVPSKKSKRKPKRQTAAEKFQQIPSKIKNIESLDKKDFDSRLLTTNQNNFLKKIITSGTMMKHTSLEQAVKSLKTEQKKKSSKQRK